MGLALSTGVTGLKAYQQMLDVAGNNLANVGTTGFKSSRITFSQLLSETIKNASQPSATIGGTNPQQRGTGVGIAGIASNMGQGNIVNTGNPLDLAIEGEGFFVLSDGERNLYTRSGVFGVDANSYLVDPATGYHVQRIGPVGDQEGFQQVGVKNVRIPYDVSLPAKATTSVTAQGNLSPDASSATTFTQKLRSDLVFTKSGAPAEVTDELDTLDQFTTGGTLSGNITITGRDKAGTAISTTLAVDGNTTIQDVLTKLNTDFADATNGATASLVSGQIILTGKTSGYSRLDLDLSCDDAELQMPGYFEYHVLGGSEVQNVSITTYDALGATHVISGAFVRTNTANEWDMVVSAITGKVEELKYLDRRIEGITFNATDGSFTGLKSLAELPEFTVTYAHDTANPQTIRVAMGTKDGFDGLTQFATGTNGTSTAVIKEQDGYTSGDLVDVSVNKEGILIGMFTNGAKKNLATLQVGLFKNPTGLEVVDSGYYIESANSGKVTSTPAMFAGAGSIHGSSLEKSNVQEADEFIQMIQAQNSYQANARTIKIANDMLKELTMLIR